MAIDRSEILSRNSPRDDVRPLGLIHVEFLGLSINWTLRPDLRDVRRYRAFDIAGILQAHAAGPTLLRDLAAGVPQALGRRRWQ